VFIAGLHITAVWVFSIAGVVYGCLGGVGCVGVKVRVYGVAFGISRLETQVRRAGEGGRGHNWLQVWYPQPLGRGVLLIPADSQCIYMVPKMHPQRCI
jgi:hypothetical protein